MCTAQSPLQDGVSADVDRLSVLVMVSADSCNKQPIVQEPNQRDALAVFLKPGPASAAQTLIPLHELLQCE